MPESTGFRLPFGTFPMGSRGPKVPADWAPDQAHPDTRRERYCLARVNGAGPSAAYAAHLYMGRGEVNKDAIKSAAHHCDREAPVAQRMAYLRRAKVAALDVPEELTGAEIAALMHEVTAAFQEAHEVAQGAVATESELAKIRQRLTVHIGRTARAGVAQKPEAKDPRHRTHKELHWCDCG